MNDDNNKIRFRKSIYFNVILLLISLVVVFFFSLYAIYYYSTSKIDEELTHNSHVLTEQISRNVDSGLRVISESYFNTFDMSNRFGSLFSMERKTRENRLKDSLQIKRHTDELLNLSQDINWIAIIDDIGGVHISSKAIDIGDDDILPLYINNISDLHNKQGNALYLHGDEGTFYFMRSIFDMDTLKFEGTIIANIDNNVISEVFDSIDVNQTGNYILYDNNDSPIYMTSTEEDLIYTNLYDLEFQEEIQDEYLVETYPIYDGRLKIIHVLNLTNKKEVITSIFKVSLIVSILSVILIIAFIWNLFGKKARSIRNLQEGMIRLSEGDFDYKINQVANEDELGLIASYINTMAEKIVNLMEQDAKNREIQDKSNYQLLLSKYNALQAQVNPHFLFNILQSINGIAQINNDYQVSELIWMLSKYFRASINRNSTLCELEKELGYIDNYLNLYQNIYPERLIIKYDIDETLNSVLVPTYFLQPIVENSIVHGLEKKLEVTTIEISVKEDNQKLIIQVYDDGDGIKPETLEQIQSGNIKQSNKERLGVGNVQERIRLLCGEEYGLNIKSVYHEYTKVRIELPLDLT